MSPPGKAHFRRLLDVANLTIITPQERAIYDENLKICTYRDWKARRWSMQWRMLGSKGEG